MDMNDKQQTKTRGEEMNRVYASEYLVCANGGPANGKIVHRCKTITEALRLAREFRRDNKGVKVRVWASFAGTERADVGTIPCHKREWASPAASSPAMRAFSL